MTVDTNRYSRQTILSEIGISGQKKLAASEVVVIGCGATGSVHAEALARSGILSLKAAATTGC